MATDDTNAVTPPPLPLPLHGVRVLELCHTIMGPSAGLVLADMGADVVKIEPAPGGDRTRRLPGFAAGFFGTFNRNKRSLGIDLKSAEGKALFLELCGEYDVVLENFAPGTMERLGLGYGVLSAQNPRLVVASLKGFLSGPYEHRPALDEVVQFMGGLAYMTGPPGQPLRAGTSVIDIMGGTFAVIAVLAALREREQTGRGQYVKSALFESTVFLVGQHLAGECVTGKPMPPMPAREGAWAVYEAFETADGEQIFVGLTSDNHWERFCTEFDRTDLLGDPELASNETRVAQRPRLLPLVANIVKQHSKSAIIEILDRISVPFAPVAKPGDLLDDPHLAAGGRLVDVDLGAGKRTRLPKLPIEMGEHDLGLRLQPPKAGEHSREILAELGLDDARIDALSSSGVILVPDEAP
ncbi:MAG: crotonobetainyl-CoA:carnitine CoA-transferase CaiB-like acyl-CoA transferase [Gammaproteobacteria bacterium]|jgi:crotonobetainyl-CoA:carnitine CoA-transferase CaiB-like acyl-CoA transferase